MLFDKISTMFFFLVYLIWDIFWLTLLVFFFYWIGLFVFNITVLLLNLLLSYFFSLFGKEDFVDEQFNKVFRFIEDNIIYNAILGMFIAGQILKALPPQVGYFMGWVWIPLW